ncbi:MgPME-cyclase complex family protein [Anabaena sp. UHCC 0451]|uniref:MgPME-cyclase complex family protein n=1 Tax=Anabaena sp. UHCC 0451 TaxID=2055235 RepID=UPI002B220777|nr:MgPME-cyclase complex family protein [Anabaena sp. UHCC 0451]MEA5578770.1 MgPME-cyclase complex family protein [Anabaena sp. UHCC 0451]
MQTYYYVLASHHFLMEEEPLEEVFKERTRNYHEQEKEIDFWLVRNPAFLEAPEMAENKAQCPQPPVAIISTNSQFITWLKLRLEYVITGKFQAPSATISDALASLTTVS